MLRGHCCLRARIGSCCPMGVDACMFLTCRSLYVCMYHHHKILLGHANAIGGRVILYITKGSLSIGRKLIFDLISESAILSGILGKVEIRFFPGINFLISVLFAIPTCSSSKYVFDVHLNFSSWDCRRDYNFRIG